MANGKSLAWSPGHVKTGPEVVSEICPHTSDGRPEACAQIYRQINRLRGFSVTLR